VTRLGADVVVELVLKQDRAEWPRLVEELCGGDASLAGLVTALLAHYGRPDGPLPSGPYPVELGPFTLERELGAGAHGKVYLARRPPLDGYVALKLLRPGPGMSEFVEQVRREAGRARRIPSAHVVPVFDAGRIENGPFYVEMAVCADPDEEAPGSIRIGRSLREAQPGLSPLEAARLVEDLAGAVHAAHRTGIVHGDVKPENVLLTPESRRVMLADFGIATSLAATHPLDVTSGPVGLASPPLAPTARGGVSTRSIPVGTVAYMAPEQWRDRLPPTPASDVYTLGGTLYFLLSGRAPHAGRIGDADPSPPPLPGGVPPRLREIVSRALSPRPEDRPSSAGALAEELRRFRTLEPTWHERRSGLRRTALFLRRHRSELVAAAAVVALVLPLVVAGYQLFTGKLLELTAREAALGQKLDALERSRRTLEADIARLEGAADSKQQELKRVEGRLAQLPRLEQALGAAKQEAERGREASTRAEGELKSALKRLATVEAQLGAAREASADAGRHEVAALKEAGRAAGERDEARRRVAEVEGQARALEARRTALEKELRENAAALGAARALADREAARAASAEREREALRARLGAAPGPGGGGPGATGPAQAEPGR
jgi:serine/threonine protein kinase/predicted  nucleic acid-binding Zn-ribbon protein